MQRNQTEPRMASYLHARGAKLGLPIGGSFELTPRCNFDCRMCYVHLNKDQLRAEGRRELTARQWIGLAREATDRGMVFALLTGGEPFLRGDFFEIYNAMKAMGLLISINTNGSLLEGDIRRQLLENPPFRVNVSLYGGCGETYRNLCGRDAYSSVVENIRALKEAGVDIRINLSITQYNRQDMAKIYDVANKLGVPVKATSYMFPSIRVNGGQYGQGDRLSPEEAAESTVAWDLLRFTPEEYAGRARNIESMGKDAGCATELEPGVSCRAGSSSFWMTWDGRMLPCGMMPWPEARPMEVGFQAAWEQIRQQTGQIRTPAACAACEKRSACGVCAAMCITETGEFNRKPEYVCRMTEQTLRRTLQACRQMERKERETG